MSLWVQTVYFKSCSSCPCIEGATRLFLCYQTFETIQNSLNGPVIVSDYNQHVYWYSGFLIAFDGQPVQTGLGLSQVCREDDGSGLLIRGRRLIVECEHESDKIMNFTVIIDDGQKPNQRFYSQSILPEFYYDNQGRVVKPSFWFNNSWPLVGIYSTTGMANLAIYYDRVLDDVDYVSKSWEALTTTYEPRDLSRRRGNFGQRLHEYTSNRDAELDAFSFRQHARSRN